MKTFEKSKTYLDIEKIFNLLISGEYDIQEVSDICNLHPTRISYLFNIIEARKNVTIKKINILSGRSGSPKRKYSIVRK